MGKEDTKAAELAELKESNEEVKGTEEIKDGEEPKEKTPKEQYKDIFSKFSEDDRKSNMTDEERENDRKAKANEEKKIKEEKEKGEKDPSGDIPEGEDDKGTKDKKKIDESKSIDESLVERVVRLGMPLKDARMIPSNEGLKGVIEHIEKAKAAGGDTEGGDTPKGDDAKKKDDLLDKLPDLTKEEYDGWEDDVKEVLGTFKDVIGELHTANKEQQGVIEELRGKMVSSEQVFVDNKITELGEDYEDMFGKGSIASVSSEHKAVREELQSYMGFVMEHAEKTKKSISKDEAFNKALSGAFGDEVSTIKGAKAAKESKKRSKKTINAPKETLNVGPRVNTGVPISEDERSTGAFDHLKNAFKKAFSHFG